MCPCNTRFLLPEQITKFVPHMPSCLKKKNLKSTDVKIRETQPHMPCEGISEKFNKQASVPTDFIYM